MAKGCFWGLSVSSPAALSLQSWRAPVRSLILAHLPGSRGFQLPDPFWQLPSRCLALLTSLPSSLLWIPVLPSEPFVLESLTWSSVGGDVNALLGASETCHGGGPGRTRSVRSWVGGVTGVTRDALGGPWEGALG